MRHGNLSGAGILLLFAVGCCSSFLESGGSSPRTSISQNAKQIGIEDGLRKLLDRQGLLQAGQAWEVNR
jgi:hypothetical protein